MLFDSTTFIIPYATGDVTVKLKDTDGNIVHDLVPNTVVFIGANKKTLNIKTQSNNKTISLSFIDMVGAQDALSRLQDLLDFFKTILPSPTVGDLNAVFIFSASASVWGLTHSLVKKPSVTTVNLNDEVIEGFIQYHDNSYITISYNQSVAGKVYLN